MIFLKHLLTPFLTLPAQCYFLSTVNNLRFPIVNPFFLLVQILATPVCFLAHFRPESLLQEAALNPVFL